MVIKNEEKFIEKILEAVFKQDLLPYKIIIVDDGSTDNTTEILKKFNVQVVNSNRKTNFYLDGGKESSKVINVGFKKLEEFPDCEFVVKLDGDHLLPKNYLSDIVERMKEDSKLAICAGIIVGEYSISPIHSGRIYRYDFLKKFGFVYPINFGAEDYFILKAQSMGLKAVTFSDIRSTALRPTRANYDNPQTFYTYGLTMKALGFAFSYVLIKSLLIGIKHPKNAFSLIRGYSSNNVSLYESELRDFVRKTQKKKLLFLKSELFKKALNLIKN